MWVWKQMRRDINIDYLTFRWNEWNERIQNILAF